MWDDIFWLFMGAALCIVGQRMVAAWRGADRDAGDKAVEMTPGETNALLINDTHEAYAEVDRLRATLTKVRDAYATMPGLPITQAGPGLWPAYESRLRTIGEALEEVTA